MKESYTIEEIAEACFDCGISLEDKINLLTQLTKNENEVQAD